MHGLAEEQGCFVGISFHSLRDHSSLSGRQVFDDSKRRLCRSRIICFPAVRELAQFPEACEENVRLRLHPTYFPRAAGRESGR
ncbi:MAG: hypothetical protein A2V98_18855 [Planctomycetes bacterium RBG_16_64_12]|nr:MAG: hypothetical protein A2V98_18855 [Planctomycetes bacterium RBG_16_64_12]